MDIIHTAIDVSDLETTMAFYCDGLGLERSWSFEYDGITNAYVTDGDGTELQFRHDPERETPIEPAGIDHLAVAVDDVEAETERLVEATGCPVVTEPMTVEPANAKAAFVEDPDGYVVELVEYLDEQS